MNEASELIRNRVGSEAYAASDIRFRRLFLMLDVGLVLLLKGPLKFKKVVFIMF